MAAYKDNEERYDEVRQHLKLKPSKWLVTGVAGFIGSNLLEKLLLLDQSVVGLDSFATGYKSNLDEVRNLVSPGQWAKFHLITGDICNLEDCIEACSGVDYVLHQAALGSVPRSVADPICTNNINIGGFLNMMTAARDAGVKSFTYAASSSTYGDHPALPKREDSIGRPLSPYAVTKFVNEIYADVFARCYGFNSIGLRYFNVFGPRQDPNGAYAAVIPKWVDALLRSEAVHINGDGQTSRDFCYVDNVVQANILAATATNCAATNQVYNVAYGARTTLSELLDLLKDSLKSCGIISSSRSNYREFRSGDVRHSHADISKAMNLLAYKPTHSLAEGLSDAIPWYINRLGNSHSDPSSGSL